jgi:23S rRNA (guanosine2251-2'-O)-methyltransferase
MAPHNPNHRTGGGHAKPPAPKSSGESSGETPHRSGEVWLYGFHAAAAALANPARKILRIAATAEAATRLGAYPDIPPRLLGQLKTVKRGEIDTLVGEDSVHQGVAVLTRPLEHDLADVLERISEPNACIVVLDQVTDPHNAGAVMRSAAAFGAVAVVAPDRHAPDETGSMAKSASGALDKIPYIKMTNLVRALELIKEFQFWIVGLAADAPADLADLKLGGRIALVLGAEDEGLRRLVRETCDHVARLPMPGGMESLNVSNAAAVALYEKARQDRKSVK